MSEKTRPTPKQAIEQIIGWAKSGKHYDRHGDLIYAMSAENVDRMADDILHALGIRSVSESVIWNESDF